MIIIFPSNLKSKYIFIILIISVLIGCSTNPNPKTENGETISESTENVKEVENVIVAEE